MSENGASSYFSKRKKTLSGIINGDLGESYSKKLLELLQNPKYVDFIKTDLKSYDLNSSENSSYAKFLFHINVLLEFYISGIDMDPQYFHDYLVISDLLKNESICEKQMDHLELDLQAYAINRGAELEPHHHNLKKLANPNQSKPFNRQKIVSGFLYQWAKDNNFNQEETQLQGNEARKNLKNSS